MMSSQVDHLAFADVCGNGLTGNAGYYARMGSSTQFDNPPVSRNINTISTTNLFPKRLEYATYEGRLESYKRPEWPKHCPVTPQLLAAAGLFYHGEYQISLSYRRLNSSTQQSSILSGNFLGNMDSVECYYCGKGLCLWEDGDDPWSEHQRVSPQCPFLHDIKNIKAYDSVKKSLNPAIEESKNFGEVTKKFESLQISQSNCPKAHCERLTCKVCLEEELSVLFLPCAHLVSCSRCAVNVTKCPLCRAPIHATIKTYLS